MCASVGGAVHANDRGSCVSGNCSPLSTLADNRYCDKAGHWTGAGNENGVLAPTACFYTGSDATPSANPPTILKATDDLTKAYAAARCGDVLCD
ncbi:MAG: hypothetical protein NVS1B11_15140 [Terriglobales bacterium]